MDKLIPVEEQIVAIADQIKSIYVETRVAARWGIIEGHHEIGKLILSLPGKYSGVQRVARLTDISERTLYYSAQFAEKFPELDNLLEDKLISWKGVVTKYLTSGSDDPHEHSWISYLVCSCGARKKQ